MRRWWWPRRSHQPQHAGRLRWSWPTRAEVIDRTKLGALLAIGIPVAVVLLPVSLGGETGWTVVVGHSMEPTLDPGDLVVTRATGDYAIGDVVVYRIPRDSPGEGVMVIHRITGGSAAEGFVTTGDNRDTHDPWRPTPGDIVGRHYRTLPSGGYVIAWLRSPLIIGLAMSVAVYMLTLELVTAAYEHEPRHAAQRLATVSI